MKQLKSSVKGYKKDSPDKNEDALRINSPYITMSNVEFPILGTDNQGNQKMMYPGMDYTFPGDYVTEVPIKQMGGNPYIQDNLVFSSDPRYVTQDDTNQLNMGTGVNPRKRKSINSYASGIQSAYTDYLANPYSLNNLLTGVNDVVNIFSQSSQARSNKNYMMDHMGSDSLFPVISANNIKGDYSVTGSSNGQFRPDQVGVKSPYGTTDMYYPKMQAGGYIDSAQDNTQGFLNDTSTGVAVPDYALPPLNPLTNGNYKQPVTNSAISVTANTKDAYNYYVKEKGLPGHIAAGIVGNLYQESGLKPGAVEQTNTGNGRGIAQWDVRDRWQGFLNWSKQQARDPYDLRTQLDYVLVEPGQSAKVLDKLKNTYTPEQAAITFGKLYERPSEKFADWGRRTSIAAKLNEGTYQEGGEYEMSQSELNHFLQDGGQIY